MLEVRLVDAAKAVPLFWDFDDAQPDPSSWEGYCRERGLSALVAECDGELMGFAVTASCPRFLHVLDLKGDTSACGVLLGRLVKLAGERDMTAWLPLGRPELHRMVRRLGFVHRRAGNFQGRPSCYYRWDRNGDVRT
jgi:hypothetical protein